MTIRRRQCNGGVPSGRGPRTGADGVAPRTNDDNEPTGFCRRPVRRGRGRLSGTSPDCRVHAFVVRSPHRDATPLLLCHGWPGSALEFLGCLPALTDPTAHGGRAEDAFHVVLPRRMRTARTPRCGDAGWTSPPASRSTRGRRPGPHAGGANASETWCIGRSSRAAATSRPSSSRAVPPPT
ncbi:hypothetical protein G3I40_28345 [Streptomyces sp. SID14478]|nr:hypothetical protein [Streptomyces sp. SID14478]